MGILSSNIKKSFELETIKTQCSSLDIMNIEENVVYIRQEYDKYINIFDFNTLCNYIGDKIIITVPRFNVKPKTDLLYAITDWKDTIIDCRSLYWEDNYSIKNVIIKCGICNILSPQFSCSPKDNVEIHCDFLCYDYPYTFDMSHLNVISTPNIIFEVQDLDNKYIEFNLYEDFMQDIYKYSKVLNLFIENIYSSNSNQPHRQWFCVTDNKIFDNQIQKEGKWVGWSPYGESNIINLSYIKSRLINY